MHSPHITIPENIVLELKLGKIPKTLLDEEQIQRVIAKPDYELNSSHD